jgi:hypothetical protein
MSRKQPSEQPKEIRIYQIPPCPPNKGYQPKSGGELGNPPKNP